MDDCLTIQEKSNVHTSLIHSTKMWAQQTHNTCVVVILSCCNDDLCRVCLVYGSINFPFCKQYHLGWISNLCARNLPNKITISTTVKGGIFTKSDSCTSGSLCELSCACMHGEYHHTHIKIRKKYMARHYNNRLVLYYRMGLLHNTITLGRIRQCGCEN